MHGAATCSLCSPAAPHSCPILWHSGWHHPGHILSFAREAEIPVNEGRFTAEALMAADECFLTQYQMEVMPATKLNGQPIGHGTPGPLTGRLHQIFVAQRRKFLESSAGPPSILLFYLVIFMLTSGMGSAFS